MSSDLVTAARQYETGDAALIQLLGALADELERLRAEIAHVRADAVESLKFWGGYASEYFQQKHDLALDIERLRGSAGDVTAPKQRAPEVCGCPYGNCTCDDGSGDTRGD